MLTRKKIMVFGTFDLLHQGHLNFFKQAKKKGNYLIAVIARDKNVKKIKSKLPHHLEKARKHIINQAPEVDKAVLGNLHDQYSVIKKYKPDIICLGYDQRVDLKELKNKLKEFGLKTKIFKLKAFHPEIYKSSKIRNK